MDFDMNWSSSFEGLSLNDIVSTDQLGEQLNNNIQSQARELENYYNTAKLVEITMTEKNHKVFIVKHQQNTMQFIVNTCYYRLRDDIYSLNLK